MTLTAKPHPAAAQVIQVWTDTPDANGGNVVARYNTTHGILTRTHYAGEKPSLKQIREAIAAIA